jgi:SnoaL-like domain
MNTEEVAKKVVELVRKQAWYEALELYDDNVVSVEAYSAGGGSRETRGKEGVRGKIDWWVNAMEIHSFDAGDPFVAHDRFVVQYDADVTDKKTKERRQLSEVGVYTVKNGKIVREEFLPRVGG